MPLNIDGMFHYTVKEIADKEQISIWVVYKAIERIQLLVTRTEPVHLISEEEYDRWKVARRKKGRPKK